MMNSVDIEYLKIFDDPVRWAYCTLRTRNKKTGEIEPWKARPYQIEVLRDKHTKKVLRWGRRCGKTETMIIKMLHKCVKTPGTVVIVATPYEHQIRAIYMRISELINDSPLLSIEIASTTKNPYVVQFKNTSRILMFTSGTRSGQAGAGLRGQKADFIYIDEADYMNDEEIEAIVSIALERPDIEIVLTSTPTGKRAFFYRACTDKKMGYKEFYTPSTSIPGWNQQMEEEFRAMFSEVGYQHEVLAEFGDEVTGVFNKNKIDDAISVLNYTYLPLNSSQLRYVKENRIDLVDLTNYSIHNPAPPGIRCVGADWDKYRDVSTIMVVEFDFNYMRFKPVYRSDIPKGEFSLDAAVNKIIEVNQIFSPQWIYCDRGFGEYQIEMLRLYGKQHPETGLDTKVKGWHFSQTIDIVDPVTKEQDKKPVKHFMVNQLSVLFDRDKIMLSPFDDLLYRQLINYSVVKITSTGAPVYTSEDEHAIDALMLAVLAFVLEMPDIASTIYKPIKEAILTQTGTNLIANFFNAKLNMYKQQNYKRTSDDYEQKSDKPPNIIIHSGNFSNRSTSGFAKRGANIGNNIRRSGF